MQMMITSMIFIMCNNGIFFLLSQKNHVIRNGHPLKKRGSVDCGTNEDLFLAIAALRDDTDKYQWFTDGDKWILCPKNQVLYLLGLLSY